MDRTDIIFLTIAGLMVALIVAYLVILLA